MGAMNLTEYRTNIRIELSDSATFFSDAEIDRGVEKTEALLARLIPKKNVVETTIVVDRSAETLIIADSVGTTSYKPIMVSSETITRSSTTYTRDTDYTINYMTGVITEIGTQMPDQSDYAITYKQDPMRLDIGSLVTNPIKVTKIEYPIGDQPPTFLSGFDMIEDYIIFHKDTILTEKKHLRIHYDSKWTGAIVIPSEWAADTVIALNEVRRPTTANATGYYYECTVRTGDFKTGGSEPTWGTTLGGTTADDVLTWTAISISDADGEYPAHLDDAIVIGASGQTLIFKAEKYVQSSITELELVNAAADAMAVPLGDINTALDLAVKTSAGGALLLTTTALDKVATYLETNESTDNAKEVLANVTDDITELRTAIETALDLSTTYLTNANTDPSAKYYLTQGDDKINALNTGDRVAEKYADYARVSIQLYSSLMNEATIRISNLRTYIEEAQAWMRMGDTFNEEAAQRLGVVNAFINEAAQRIAEVNAWATQADRYRTTSQEYLNIAGRYLASGQAKINEFYVMLGFKPELQHAQSSTSQATRY